MNKYYRISNNNTNNSIYTLLFSSIQSDMFLPIWLNFKQKKRIIMTLTNVQTLVLGVKIIQSD